MAPNFKPQRQMDKDLDHGALGPTLNSQQSKTLPPEMELRITGKSGTSRGLGDVPIDVIAEAV